MARGGGALFGQPMRRMVLNQGHEIPEWMSLQGLQLAWSPRRRLRDAADDILGCFRQE